MNSIWFLSKDRNLCLTVFNRVVKKDGQTELWATDTNGSSMKLATGEKAVELENALLEIVWKHSPAVITDGNGNFSTNVRLDSNDEIEEEVE